MSQFKQYQAGLGNAASYQVSGRPWITGSSIQNDSHKISFPSVAKSVTVINVDPDTTDEILVHFNATGSGRVIAGEHFHRLYSKTDNVTFNVKCREIYVTNTGSTGAAARYRVLAELTGIDVREMFVLTGSGLTD